MGSKAFLFLGLLLALVLLISSEVAAVGLAETHEQKADSHGVNDAKYGGDNGGRDDYPGRGGGGRGRDYPPRGRGCYHGCCRLNRSGPGCLRCCSYAGEAVDAQTETKPQN